MGGEQSEKKVEEYIKIAIRIFLGVVFIVSAIGPVELSLKTIWVKRPGTWGLKIKGSLVTFEVVTLEALVVLRQQLKTMVIIKISKIISGNCFIFFIFFS